jgi:putative ABC transport system permease protein
LPGVDGVGAANVLPLSGMISRTDFTISGRPPLSPTDTPAAQSRWVSPAYFQTMKIPIREGRDFSERDNETGARVVVVDQSLARRHWQNESPIGSHLRLDFGNGDKPHEFEVVGVSGNVKHSGLNEEATATLYAPLHQIPKSMASTLAANLSIVVQSATDPRTLTESVRRELQSVDPEVPASNVKTMDEFLAASVASRRFNLMLLTTFAGAALVLAAAGLYGVVSYTVTQRTPEIGIRMALGGEAGDMLRLVIAQGMKLALIGVGMGLVAALAVTRLMSSLLFGVTATDPLTFTVIAMLLTAVALLACWIPARRATKVDPLVALRHE